ncbi:hypothetical protein fugu_017768 [Takifugu bimaculatus]|uniref:Uncharacterized protein n=1 Tax=Takifugu bimaculatus TaxID=433685 RepID=A0A4Z2BSD2_9TELE|nr:hypothetical protein fugu_017768 [Takifugu bimaculatus]
MKLVNTGGGGGGGGGTVGGGGGAGVGGGAEKTAFSFKKCSAFQFVKRKVRRWMRNPKVTVEKAQGKGLLYPCPKCPLADDLWYTHFPSPYGCCHYGGLQGGQYYQQEPCSLCLTAGQTSYDKGKGCKIRRWKMLGRHHGDSSAKPKESESDVHLCGLSVMGSPPLSSPEQPRHDGVLHLQRALHRLHPGGQLAATATHAGHGSVLAQRVRPRQLLLAR